MIYDHLPLPVAWQWKRLKYLASYNDSALSESTDPSTEFRYIEISDVSLAAGISNATPMSFLDAPSRARRVVRKGDILVSTVRTYLKAIAIVSEDTDDLIASTGFCVIRAREGIDTDYLGWVLKSDVFVDEVVSQSVGVSYPAINAPTLMDIKIPVPPLKTQSAISAFLDARMEKIDQLSGKIEIPRGSADAISRLQREIADYRASLIFHAVLGQIEGLR
jgi:type I restriction enzyme, S subunit